MQWLLFSSPTSESLAKQTGKPCFLTESGLSLVTAVYLLNTEQTLHNALVLR